MTLRYTEVQRERSRYVTWSIRAAARVTVGALASRIHGAKIHITNPTIYGLMNRDQRHGRYCRVARSKKPRRKRPARDKPSKNGSLCLAVLWRKGQFHRDLRWSLAAIVG